MTSRLSELQAQARSDDLIRAAERSRLGSGATRTEVPPRRTRIVAHVVDQLRRRDAVRAAPPVPTAHPSPEAWPD